MTKRGRTAIFVCVGIITSCMFGALLAHLLLPSEPVYEGRKLTAWLEDLNMRDSGGRGEQAERAVRQIGTNAIKTLLDMLRSPDSPAKLKFWEWGVTLTGLTPRHFKMARDRRHEALKGFLALGPIGEPAIPALIDLLDSPGPPHDDASRYAAIALVGIGEKAIRPLTQAFTNADERVRRSAVGALTSSPFDIRSVLPAFLKTLRDESPAVRVCALVAFINNPVEPTAVVPLLTENLAHTNANIRRASALALAAYGNRAREAVPVLLKCAIDQDSQVRDAVTNALRRINADPAVELNQK